MPAISIQTSIIFQPRRPVVLFPCQPIPNGPGHHTGRADQDSQVAAGVVFRVADPPAAVSAAEAAEVGKLSKRAAGNNNPTNLSLFVINSPSMFALDP